MLPTPHSFRPESLVGVTLDGRYRLTAHLASGGMGSVFRAEQVYMRKELALKLLRPELSALPDIAERFRREAEIAASLEHDHIVRVTDFGRSPEGWLFLAMELLEGESLFDRLRREDRLEPAEALAILVRVCRGLEAAHRRGVVHRDLKPENVFLTRGGGVKILDFGIAKLHGARSTSDTQVGVVVGTPEYLSPEQALGRTVDARADVYAVGLIAWRMLVGHHPFHADDTQGLVLLQATRPVPPLTGQRPELAAWPALVAAIERACEKDAAARFATAAELGDALEAVAAVSRPAAPPPLPTPSTGSVLAGTSQVCAVPTVPLEAAPAVGRRRIRAGVSVAAALATAVALLGGTAAWRWAESRVVDHARELLAAGRPDAAREALARALVHRPGDPRLLALHGRALHRIPGQGAAALEAYAAALELDPAALDRVALEDLSGDLRDPALADAAARLLVRAGPAAVPAVVAATRAGPGPVRLRAVDLARELGAQDGVDRLAVYSSLLADPDCDVRRVAARQLGDLGDPAAVAALADLARQTRDVRGLLGFTQHVPQCGAAEADAALKRLAAPSAQVKAPLP